jgi:perosamine synthetase
VGHYFAPAGTPVQLSEIVAGAFGASFSSAASATLEQRLGALSGSQVCRLVSSGRAAMTLLMAAVRELRAPAGRDEVIVAGYTCYSVPASIKRGGLRVRLCDVDPRTLSFDLDALRRLDLRKVAAIVSANLYGIPNDLPEVEAFARQHDLWLVDDAAQALGARVADRPVGGFGAAGLYSFDKGKNITTIQGGAALVRDPTLAAAFQNYYERLPRPSRLSTATLLGKLGVYALALRPAMYDRIQRIGALGLGRTIYEEEYPIHRYSESLSGIALKLLDRLDNLTATRVANAARIRQALSGINAVRFVAVRDDSDPAFTRFPVFISDATLRDRTIAALQSIGIGATGSYPNALCDVPEVARGLRATDGDLPGAREVARTVVTLPTHPFCPPDLASRIERCATAVLADRIASRVT